MAEWQQLAQSVFLGFIFSFLLAKLFSIIFSFREDNLRVVRGSSVPDESTSPSKTEPKSIADNSVSPDSVISGFYADEVSVAAEDALTSSIGGDDSDDDWEGVESTELDEVFSAATAFVAATAVDRASQKVSPDVQLQLYGLYKIATEGPCSAPQPSAFKMTARAKWLAWQKLGAMPPEEAMQKYIEMVTELYPSWAAGSTMKSRGGDSGDPPSTDSRGPMGPVFSTIVYEEGSENELMLDDIHTFAREGDLEKLLTHIEAGASVNHTDSEGRTALHWAVDRGHLNIAELLLSRNADVNAKDNEGQTPLHYAAICEREDISEVLVKRNAADIHAKDNDGNTPLDICESKWAWLQPTPSHSATD